MEEWESDFNRFTELRESRWLDRMENGKVWTSARAEANDKEHITYRKVSKASEIHFEVQIAWNLRGNVKVQIWKDLGYLCQNAPADLNLFVSVAARPATPGSKHCTAPTTYTFQSRQPT